MYKKSCNKIRLYGSALLMCVSSAVFAEIKSSSQAHFELFHQAKSSIPPTELWQRLIKPSQWWHPDHSYSGNADNLSLEAEAGGEWREDWSSGSVVHGRILYIEHGKQLRLSAPFGPLQQKAVSAIWTITIQPDETGSLVTFEETVNGTNQSQLDKLAPAVDYVKDQALKRLVKQPD